MPLTKTLLDVMCELLADTNSPLVQEPVVKSLLLLFGPIVEQHLERFIDQGMNYLAENLISIPETPNIKVLSLDIDEFVISIENSVPGKSVYSLLLLLIIVCPDCRSYKMYFWRGKL